jgi:hypothetical protein
MQRDGRIALIFNRDAIDQPTMLVQPANLVHHPGLPENFVSKVQAVENTHRVGPDSNSGADLEQRGRLFEDLRLKPVLAKRERRSQPTNPAANDRYPHHSPESATKKHKKEQPQKGT